MLLNPSVYCSAPHPPQLYGCAFKTKSSVHLGWPQKGLDGDGADPLGNGKPPPGPELGSSEQSSFLLGISVHPVGASGMRNPSPAFKCIWCEWMWSLQHHICYQGEDTGWPWRPTSLGSAPAMGEDGCFGAAHCKQPPNQTHHREKHTVV